MTEKPEADPTNEAWRRKRSFETDSLKSGKGYTLMSGSRTDMVIKMDCRGCLTFVSPSYGRLAGKREQDLIGEKYRPFFPGKDPESGIEDLKAMFVSSPALYAEQRIPTREGCLWLEWVYTTVPDTDGEVREIIGVGRDITERKQRESALASRAALEALIAKISHRFQNLSDLDASINVCLEDMGRFCGAGRSYLFQFGTDGLVMSNTHEWCSEGVQAEIHNLRNLPVTAFPWWMAQLREGKTIHLENVADLPPEADVERNILEAQNIKSVLVVPLRIENKLAGFLGFDDISSSRSWTREDLIPLRTASEIIGGAIERKRAEMSLRISEARLTTIFEAMEEPVYVSDPSTYDIIYMNSVMRRLFGSPGGKKCHELLQSSDKPCPFCTNAFITGDNFGKTHTWEFHNQVTRKWFRCIDRALHWPDGRIVRYEMAIDITEYKLAEQERIKAVQKAAEHEKLALVGRIAGKMAHDFNNVLGVIMGNSELAMLSCADPKIKRILDLILVQTIRGRNLTRNLVAFAKDQEPQQEYLPVNEKMDMILTLLGKDLEKIRVIRQYEKGLPDLPADPGMIEHAMINLIQNSIHALSLIENPVITIRTFHREGRIGLEIEDNGCGIPREHLEDVFAPAFTLKGGRDRFGMYRPGIKGTGYGMSNVKKYIDLHKGEVSLDSELGKGTRILITLPLGRQVPARKAEEKPTHGSAVCGSRILMVEDEPAIVDVQKSMLTQFPFHHEVDVATDGSAAMDLFAAGKYDAVSLDYVLPGEMNGMDIYHYIRKTDPVVPILFASGNLEFLESVKMLKNSDPYVDHVSKPCTNAKYIERIHRLIENRSA